MDLAANHMSKYIKEMSRDCDCLSLSLSQGTPPTIHPPPHHSLSTNTGSSKQHIKTR